MIDNIIAVGFLLLFGGALWGMILQANDQQKLREDRNDYTRMKKFMAENDSSRL